MQKLVCRKLRTDQHARIQRAIRFVPFQEESMKKSVSLLCFVAFCLSLASPLLAQEAAVARLSLWNVKRTHWRSYVENWKENQKPVLDKLLAEGKIKDYGLTTAYLHDSSGYTHVAWVSADDLSGLEAVADANRERRNARSDKERDQGAAEFTSSIQGHTDTLVRSLVFESRPADVDSGYFTTSSVKVKRGHGAEWRELWNKYTKPVLAQLLANGTILSYGLDVELVHTEALGTYTQWIGLASAEAHTKMRAAFQADRDKRSAEERRAVQDAFWSHVVAGEHRDSMTSIVHYAVK